MMVPETRLEHLYHCMIAAGYTYKRECRAPFEADAMADCFYTRHWWNDQKE